MTGLHRDELANYLFYHEELNRNFRREITKIWTDCEATGKHSDKKLETLLGANSRDMLFGIASNSVSNTGKAKRISRAQAVRFANFNPAVAKTQDNRAHQILEIAASLDLLLYVKVEVGDKTNYAIEPTELLDKTLHRVFSQALRASREREDSHNG